MDAADLDALRLAFLSPWCLGLLGLFVGSFINVLVHRLPLMLEHNWAKSMGDLLQEEPAMRRAIGLQRKSGGLPEELRAAGERLSLAMSRRPTFNLALPRSRCPKCGHRIHWYENIPVVSWLFLRGACSSCDAPISVRYPMVEMATGVLFVLSALMHGPNLSALVWALFLATLLGASLIDLDTMMLPDEITLPLLWLGLAAAAAGLTIPPAAAIIGAAVGFSCTYAIAKAVAALRRVECLGSGDIVLMAALGAWLGWQWLIPITLVASLSSLITALIQQRSSRSRDVVTATGSTGPMPFGPHLAVAAAAASMLPEPLVERVVSFLLTA